MSRSLAVVLGLLILTTPDNRKTTRLDDATLFEFVGISPDSATFTDGEIRLDGKSRGYLATKATHGEFRLRFEWRFETEPKADLKTFEANSGVLLAIRGKPKVWPTSIEVQLTPQDPCSLFGLGMEIEAKIDPNAQRQALKPASDWNQVEIDVVGNTITTRLNGAVIASGSFDGQAGPIGFQSQGTPIHFRNVEVNDKAK